MCKKLIFLAALVLMTVASASANETSFTVSIDTSSISGTQGSLDFEFNPGPLVSAAATLDVEDFNGGSVTGSPSLTGDASGALPGTIAFDNGTGFNDYFQTFTFGSTISFEVLISGSPLTGSSGSSFAFTMYSDPSGTMPVLTTLTNNPSDSSLVTQINPDGSVTTTSFVITPEPTSMVLFGTGLLGVIFVTRKRLFTYS